MFSHKILLSAGVPGGTGGALGAGGLGGGTGPSSGLGVGVGVPGQGGVSTGGGPGLGLGAGGIPGSGVVTGVGPGGFGPGSAGGTDMKRPSYSSKYDTLSFKGFVPSCLSHRICRGTQV